MIYVSNFKVLRAVEMPKVHWTGHPFVDAGLAALAAGVGVRRLEDLMPMHLQTACEKLTRILLSDQALGIGVEKSFLSSSMSQLFPNSEFVNPSPWSVKLNDGKRRDVRKLVHSAALIPAEWQQVIDEAKNAIYKALQDDLQRAQRCLQSESGDEICFACGELRPSDAMVIVRKDKMPLLEGIVNFYPAFAYGVRICGLCALAVRFLPFSVLRTGEGKRLWFLHTQALSVASIIAQTYGWEHFDRAVSANKVLDFFGSWQTAGDAGTVLYVLCELLERFRDQLWDIYLHPLPTTAYLFSNDNRGGYIQALPIPNELLTFFAKLQSYSTGAFRRFWRELLEVSPNLSGKKRKERVSFVKLVALRILNMKPIVGVCLDDNASKLIGGWIGHRFYLQEVLGMPLERLAILERLGIAIAQSEDAKKLINELRSARGGELYGVLLSYVRRGWLKHDEFYTLLPPNDYGAAGEIRDILLAVIYEWQRCRERGEEFPALAERAELTPDETLARIQQIGERLLKRLSNFKRWLGRLQMARTTAELRGVYLTAVRHGALSFSDFVFLAPLGSRQTPWLLRDYLLAFLFEKVREELPELGVEAGVEEDEIAVIEPEQVEIEGGET